MVRAYCIGEDHSCYAFIDEGLRMRRFVISEKHGVYRCVLWHPLQFEHLGLTARQLNGYLSSHDSKRHFLGENFDVLLRKSTPDREKCRSKFSEFLKVELNNAIVMVDTVRMERITGDLLPDNYPLESEVVLVGDVRIMADAAPMYKIDFDSQLNAEESLFEFRPRVVMDPSNHQITSIIAFDLKHRQPEYA